jgi:hypothetical protein
MVTSRLAVTASRREDGKPCSRRAAGREQGSGGRERVAGMPVRSRRKRDEPQGRQQGATNLRDRGGANRRGGAKPRGRNMVGGGTPARRQSGGDAARPGVDSPVDVGGGAIFGQPQERISGVFGHRNARTGMRRERRRGRSRGWRRRFICVTRRPRAKVIEGPRGRRESDGARKAMDGSGKPTSRDDAQEFPPRPRPVRPRTNGVRTVRTPQRCGVDWPGTKHLSQDSSFRFRGPWSAEAEFRCALTRRRSSRPEDPVNLIPGRRAVHSGCRARKRAEVGGRARLHFGRTGQPGQPDREPFHA